jgi:hypothetical protein
VKVTTEASPTRPPSTGDVPSLPGMEGQEDMSTTVRKKARLSRQRAVRKKARLSGVTHWAAHK